MYMITKNDLCVVMDESVMLRILLYQYCKEIFKNVKLSFFGMALKNVLNKDILKLAWADLAF